ncbi:MAG TPA: hypothetical protein PLY12_12075 [Bacillota bacterium]|nr:hypothetical protein [Bacillota bacterium]
MKKFEHLAALTTIFVLFNSIFAYALPQDKGRIDNINPVISLNVTPVKKPVDIVILTDYTGTKLSALNSRIDALKAEFSAVNVDPAFHIISDVKKIGTQSDELYWYRRYAHLKYQVNCYQTYTHNQSWNYYYNYDFDDTLLWEQMQGLAGQVGSMPKRNPTNVSYSKGPLIYWENSSGNTRKRYYNVTITCSNDVKTYGVIEQQKYYDRLDGNGAHYSWDYLKSESVSIDSKWTREEKISNVTYDVYSMDFSKLNTLPLRSGSDRHMVFLSDASGKNFGSGFGNYFCFGDMTDSFMSFITENRFELYGVVPEETKDMTILPDKVSKVFPLGDTTILYMQSGEIMKLGDKVLAGTLANGEKMFPGPISGMGGIKQIIHRYAYTYLLMDNGSIKYLYNYGNDILNLPGISGTTKIFYDSSYIYAVNSSGKIFEIINDRVTPYNNSFVCDRVITFEPNGPPIFISTDGTAYMRYYQSDRLYKTESYYFTQPRIRNKNTGAISYLGSIKDAAAYRISGSSYQYGYPIAVLFTSGLMRQFAGTAQTVISDDRYYTQYTEFLYDPAYYIDEANVDRIENSQASIFIYKKDGTVKMLTTDWRQEHGEDGYYWAPVLRNYLVNVPLSNIRSTYKTPGKYFITDSNDVTYLYNGCARNENPVIGTTLINIGTGVKKIQERAVSSYRYLYILYNNKTVREISAVNESSYISSNILLPYDNIKDINSSNKNTYLLTSNGQIYGTGDSNYGQLGYKGYASSGFVNSYPSTINYDSAKTYLSLLDIFRGMANSEFFAAGQYTAAFNKIYNGYQNNGDGKVYVLLGEDMEYQSTYSDYENDPEYCRRWRICHDPDYFDNGMGLSAYHNPAGFTDNPPVKLDKVGKYIIDLKARDNPISDLRFLSDTDEDRNYYKWSLGEQSLTAYVHRRPIARQRITIEDNGNGTYRVKAFDAGSYDPDHTSRADKGIAAREWRWRDDSRMVWHYEQMDKSDCDPQEVYTLQLRVQDLEGAWSDYNTIEIANNPPIALFSIDKNPIFDNEMLLVKDQSVTQSFAALTRWHWIIKKYNEDDTLPDTDIQNDQFSASNGGTGDMAGYDTNVKTGYSDTGAGKYRIYLRVKDSNGMWSDEGTDSTYNLNGFYAMDFIVQESFKMSNFRVVLIRDLHLEPYYNVNGEYRDKPFYADSMAIDPSNFMIGGVSLVPGFSSLTKGYRFEFEIDTTNFNEADDTLEVVPAFYPYTKGIPGFRGAETDLYWEDSDKRLHKSGEGGHSKWETVVLDSSNRIITGENEATWRGEYFIPATSWLVPQGTSAADAKANRINEDIIVNFTIRGYRDGEMKYDYNEKQWPIERTEIKHPYEIGDVIRYDHTKSSLDDIDIIINRP